MRKFFFICAFFVTASGLAGKNLSDSWKFDLTGNWKMMRGNNSLYSRVDFDDSSWPKIKLPSKHLMPSDTAKLFGKEINNSIDPHKGYVWYRKTIEINTLPPEDCSLQIQEIMNADRVYINGIRIGSSGRFPPNFRSAWSKFRSYPIPNLMLRKGKNTIAIQVYYNSEAWIMGPMKLTDARSGKTNKLIMDMLLNYTMQGFTFLLFPISVFFFLLFLRRKNELSYLFFAICTLMLSVLISLQYIENLYFDIPVSSNDIFKITQTGMIWFPPFLALFFRSYVFERISWKRIIVYSTPSLIFWILMISAAERHQILMWRNYFLLLIPFFSFDIIYVSFSQLLKKNRRGSLIFIGMLPIILLGFHDVLAFSLHVIDSGVALFVYGIPILLLIVALHLVNRFVTSLNKSEELNLSLQKSLIEKERLISLERELLVARGLQLSSVPKKLPNLSAFNTAVKFEPMEKIGGDFYNFAELDDNRMGVLLSDVSGHGIPAALIAAMVQVSFNVLQHLVQSPSKLLIEMNNILYKLIKNNFLTASYALLDMTTSSITFSRAGHEPLLIYRKAEDRIEEILPRGRAIGLSEELPIEEAVTSINRGDRVILYTDCITEAFSPDRKMYGMDNFKNFIRSNNRLSPSQFCDSIYEKIQEWVGTGEKLSDDFTLVIVDIQ